MSDHGITGTGRRRAPVLTVIPVKLDRKLFKAIQKRAREDGIGFQRECRKLIDMELALS